MSDQRLSDQRMSEHPRTIGSPGGADEAALRNRERFEQMMIPLWNQLARYCNTVAGDHDTARDLMSETMLLAFQSFHQLRDPAAFKSYLFKIAVRVNQDWSKRAKRNTPLTSELAVHLENTTLKTDGFEPERALAVSELYSALGTLPEKQREAVILFEVSGLSLTEIRDIQGGSLSGVKSRIARGREELAKKLGVRNNASAKATSTAPQQSAPSQSFAHERASTVLAFSMKAKL